MLVSCFSSGSRVENMEFHVALDGWSLNVEPPVKEGQNDFSPDSPPMWSIGPYPALME